MIVSEKETTGLNEIQLTGLDGSNPLAFLAALGTLAVISRSDNAARLGWQTSLGMWRPVLSTNLASQDELLDRLAHQLRSLSMDCFARSKKMPFAARMLREMMGAAVETAGAGPDRREADLLAAMGCEAITDGDDFVDTAFRMVRSGDSAGQGLPAYALAIRAETDRESLERALFRPWDYADNFRSFRWDPIEDSRYALQWRDPAKSPNQTMLGANSLAIEALAFYPVVPRGSSAVTTGFATINRQEHFSWPIWEARVAPDVIRTLVSLPELHDPIPDSAKLRAMGIAEVFRCRRFAPNQYYKNFGPAVPA